MISIHGRIILTGKVVSTKMNRTIIIRHDYLHYSLATSQFMDITLRASLCPPKWIEPSLYHWLHHTSQFTIVTLRAMLCPPKSELRIERILNRCDYLHYIPKYVVWHFYMAPPILRPLRKAPQEHDRHLSVHVSAVTDFFCVELGDFGTMLSCCAICEKC